jgi:hypothetical protein
MLVAAAPVGRLAAQDTNAAAAKPEKPPPLPLHQIEGNGGIFSTLSAYLVNPPRDGEPVGRPAVGFSYVNLGHGQNLEAFTLTETPWKRLELGSVTRTSSWGTCRRPSPNRAAPRSTVR